MHYYERKYGDNKIPIFVKFFIGLWFGILSIITFTMYKQDVMEFGLFIFYGFSVLFFGIFILTIKRTNVFVYRDYLQIRSTFGSKEVQFFDIALIDYVVSYSSSNNGDTRVNRYIELYDMYDNQIGRVSTHLLGHHDAQREFVQMIRERSRHAKLTNEMRIFLGEDVVGHQVGREDKVREAVKSIEFDEKTIKTFKIVGITIAVFIAIPFILPLVLGLIFLFLE